MTDSIRHLCKVRFEPSGLKTEVPRGSTLLDAARLAGVYLNSLCGGDGTCGKCKVHVQTPAAPGGDRKALAAGERTVLACRERADGDVVVTVPQEAGLRAARILVGIDTHDGPHTTAAGSFPFDPPVPTPADAPAQHFGLAVDVGTTTVVAHLVDYSTRETAGAEATYNSQMTFGEDYIRRIMYAESNDAYPELQRLIARDIDGLVTALASRFGIKRTDILALYAAGNTAMIHLLLGRDAGWIRRGQDRPDELAPPPCPAADLGIHIAPGGLLHALPAVGAYVGADIVAGVLATALYDAPDLALLIDIGTNGEIVLGGREWMACASSSAGPAFEGAGIRCGMRATAGAIERFSVADDGTFRHRTVDGGPPVGLCGSGLLDLVAEFFRAGVIDRTGRFARDDDPRLRDGPDGPEMVLVAAAEERAEIVITQADILNLIRSKAGVYAAVQALLEATGRRPDEVQTIYVAGGFGNYLDPEKAMRIGLLPDVPIERIRFVGNSSIAGAKMALMSRAALGKAEEIAGRMTYFDLMTHPGYMDAFIRANFLPHTDLALFPSVRTVAGVQADISSRGAGASGVSAGGADAGRSGAPAAAGGDGT